LADNYTVLNSAAAVISISAKEETTGLYSPRVTPRIAGTDVSVANPMPTLITNTALASIDTKTLAAGQALMAASYPVALASNQSAIPVNVLSTTGGWSSTDSVQLASLNTKAPALGQAVMAGSIPVALASNQSALPVTVSGVATAVKQPNFGTAAAPAADVVTVQGISGGTPLAVVVSNTATTVVAAACSLGIVNLGNVKNSSGVLHGYVLFNGSAATALVKLYDTNATPNSSMTPKMIVGLSAGSSANVSFQKEILFSTGIGYRVTTVSDTAVSAAECMVNLLYT